MSIPTPNIRIIQRKGGLVLEVAGVMAAGVTAIKLEEVYGVVSPSSAIITLTVIRNFIELATDRPAA